MPTDKKSAKRPGRIKDLKSKKVESGKAEKVKGGMNKQDLIDVIAKVPGR